MNDFLQSAITLLAICNPVGAAPIFLSLVATFSPREKKRAARTAAIGVAVILLISALAGRYILELFGVSIAAFRAAGGLVIVLMGLEMLRGEMTSVHADGNESYDRDEQILVPFTMPLVAGPGSIATIVTLAISETSAIPVTAMSAAITVAVVLWVVLQAVIMKDDLMSERAQRIGTRFMGLVLVAVGFQLGLGGVQEFFGLAATAG